MRISTTSLILAAVLCTPPHLLGQTNRIVDVQGSGTNIYTTITAAAADAVSGDTILIKQLEWPANSGQIVGYNETHAGGTETFPIEIESGVMVKPFDSTHTVLVWSNATTPPSALFSLLGTNSPAPITRVEDLILFGANAGIECKTITGTQSAAPEEITAIVARVDFGWNHIAFDATYSDTTQASLALRDCRIVDNTIPLPTGYGDGPIYQPQSIGIRLHAKETATKVAARIDAEIRNLKTVGVFNSIDPSFVILPEFAKIDLGANLENFSRLIEVYAEGDGSTLEHSQTNPFAPIPQVNVLVAGGTLSGAASAANPSFGWDVGIFSSAHFPGSADLDDFTAGYDVTCSGAILDGFRLAGIHGTGDLYTRGTIRLDGNTQVTGTGPQANRTPFQDLYNGVHMYEFEGYLGLQCADATISGNAGHGVFLRTEATVQRDSYDAAAGNYLKMESCDIHSNGGSGIKMKTYYGMVGGALHYSSNGAQSFRNIPGITYSVDYGQGSVNRCNISNNSEYGLEFEANGNSDAAVSTRFVNSIIWNNTLGGYYANLSGESSKPFFLAPLLHCTLAGNGGSANYTADILEENRLAGEYGVYEWSGYGGKLHTKFFDTIFERKVATNVDFSPALYDFMVDDLTPPANNEIGVAGIRGYVPGGGAPPFAFSINEATPFVSGSSWTSLDPSNYYLLNLGSGGDFGKTPGYVPVISTESFKDHSGDIRPPISTGLRDKGAEELN
jgi:parallel beta helix pectate lyase-like protein